MKGSVSDPYESRLCASEIIRSEGGREPSVSFQIVRELKIRKLPPWHDFKYLILQGGLPGGIARLGFFDSLVRIK
jgi:hypothetical protein